MKKLIFMCLVVFMGGILSAQTDPQWVWATCAGGMGNDWGFHGPTDQWGRSYMTGYFSDSADFGSNSYTSSGGLDVFIAQLDTNGSWLWVKTAGGTSLDQGAGIALDFDGCVYVSGSFNNSATFGTTTLTSHGAVDIFVAKLDNNGNWIWAVNAGGTSDDYGLQITTDSVGNSYITGQFSQTANFGVHSITSVGAGDIYIAKLDSQGNWLWATRAGGPGDDFGYGITRYQDGNVYTSGDFHGVADFGATSLTSTGLYYNNYVAKLDTNGNWLWATRGGGAGDAELAPAISVGQGGIHVAGYFAGTADFGAVNLTSQGSADIYVACMDMEGNWLWATRAGGTLWDAGFDIVVDVLGNSYVSGIFRSSSSFGFNILTALGDGDAFVAKVTDVGNWEWVLRGGGNGIDSAVNISTDGNGNMYVSGGFSLTTTYGSTSYTSSGGYDILIAKLSTPVPVDDELAPGLAGMSCLYNAYPNPFRSGGSTIIKANVATNENGTLAVYNLKGQRVASYQLSSGPHEISFSGRDLPAGLYLYQLRTPTVETTRKLVLWK